VPQAILAPLIIRDVDKTLHFVLHRMLTELT